uniref:Uncharacterized protein n=1 Tax=Rhizophora mucronata TaxID=61149 RepID=A0A2P2Q748_RHIMU
MGRWPLYSYCCGNKHKFYSWLWMYVCIPFKSFHMDNRAKFQRHMYITNLSFK